jgi:hypothetical protein
MAEPWAGELEGAKQGAEWAALVGFHLAWRAAVWTGRAGSEKRVDLSLQQAVLDGFEELFGFLESQAQMFDALAVLLQGDNIGDGGFMAIIISNNELQFDTHGGASPGSGGRGMMPAIVPEIVPYPQLLHALPPVVDTICCRRDTIMWVAH